MYVHVTRKVGPKGQVVIPREIREELGITPGTELEFDILDKKVLVKPAKSAKERMKEFLSVIPEKKKLKKMVDIDELMDSQYEEELSDIPGR